MQLYLAKVVNRGLAGESQHACLQIESNKIFEFSQILGESINDNDISHPTIQRILNSNHTINITFDESDNVTLYF
jgi:hypothetical protein